MALLSHLGYVLNDEINDNVIAFNCKNAQNLSLPKSIMHNLLVHMTCISRLNCDVTFSWG